MWSRNVEVVCCFRSLVIAKISDLNKIVKILEEKVEVNAKTIKVKDEACKEFKRVSSESNKRLNEAQEKLEAMQIQPFKPVKASFHCPLCNYQVEGVTKLRTHLQRNHSRDQKCQTINPCVQEQDKLVYPCFYCGFELNCDQNLRKHKTECHMNDFLLNNVRGNDVNQGQINSEILSDPFPSISFKSKIPCFSCN